ncbi:MAG: hypothetical protein Q7S32_04220 [bacterium]|nr:hypothetical protein [bacterium]
MKNDKSKTDELDEVEEKLLREDAEKRKEKMPVSGRSVFEIQKLKNKKKEPK